MKLLLDLGNTRLKWALHDRGRWHAQGAVAWDASVAEELAAAWCDQPAVEAALGASVADPARSALVATQVKSRFGCEPRWLRSPAHAGGVRNAYAEPERLGVDRFLAMLAAYAGGHAPCVLVGVGTALTLDALAADGRHLGGLIAPGPRLMREALLGATARVQVDRPGAVRARADNTPDAVVSGCWGACVALVERFHRQVSDDLGGAPALLLGGGDAAELQALLAAPSRLLHDSVLHGLAAWDVLGTADGAE